MKALKSQLAALDRKITAELAQKHDETANGEVIKQQSQHSQSEVTPEATDNNVNVRATDSPQKHKTSMVAEPGFRYPISASVLGFSVRHP